MTDPDIVREQLRRLARGAPVPPWGHDRVIERAIAASDDVAAAAAFAADGGCDRLASAIERTQRAGREARADEGRAVLAEFERFEQACSAGRDSRDVADGVASGGQSRSLSLRSRNP